MLPALTDLLAAALAKRRPLLAAGASDAYRLFHGGADGLEGLVIERFGDVLIVQLHADRLPYAAEHLRSAVQWLHEELGTTAVYKKIFVRDRSRASAEIAAEHLRPTPWIGRPVEPRQSIREHALRFIIRPYDGFSVGLFLEHRDNRRRIRELAAGRRVLNAFCYTGGFSVAAAAGGAASVASMDTSKRCLQWCRENFAANGLDPAGHWFFCSDVFDFLKRAGRQGRRYELIILDPPSFGRARRSGRPFVLAEQLGDLLAGALDLLEPGGLLFLATNHRQIGLARLESELLNNAKGRPARILERPPLPADFAGEPDYAKSVLARYD